MLCRLQVKVWFQNRRMKWRHTKESESAALSNLDSQKDSSRKLGKDNGKSEKTASEDEEDIEIEVDVWTLKNVYILTIRLFWRGSIVL